MGCLKNYCQPELAEGYEHNCVYFGRLNMTFIYNDC